MGLGGGPRCLCFGLRWGGVHRSLPLAWSPCLLVRLEGRTRRSVLPGQPALLPPRSSVPSSPVHTPPPDNSVFRLPDGPNARSAPSKPASHPAHGLRREDHGRTSAASLWQGWGVPAFLAHTAETAGSHAGHGSPRALRETRPPHPEPPSLGTNISHTQHSLSTAPKWFPKVQRGAKAGFYW